MQKSNKKRKLVWILGVIMILVIAIVTFFQIPYSPTRSEFRGDVQRHMNQSAIRGGVFTEQDIADLPEPIQNHLRSSGVIGQPIMSGFTMFVPSARLYESRDRPLTLDYTLYVFAYSPVRLAYMNTSMFGIPFEAYDRVQHGEGVMRGVIGKVIPLFNETGSEMDQGQLLTYLGEFALMPSFIFSDYVTWEPIDAYNARATITYGEISGSGIFTLGDDGFIRYFRTSERAQIHTDGSINFVDWSVVYEDWIRSENGMYMLSNFRVIWHEPEGDLVYFEPVNGFSVEFH